jgi:hypothetical protein
LTGSIKNGEITPGLISDRIHKYDNDPVMQKYVAEEVMYAMVSYNMPEAANAALEAMPEAIRNRTIEKLAEPVNSVMGHTHKEIDDFLSPVNPDWSGGETVPDPELYWADAQMAPSASAEQNARLDALAIEYYKNVAQLDAQGNAVPLPPLVPRLDPNASIPPLTEANKAAASAGCVPVDWANI